MIDKLEGPPSLANMAYRRLRQAILDGDLESGKTYVETSIARQLGISRTPVREALLELSAQGLVSFLPRKGVQIKHFTPRDAGEVFELRDAIELAIVEKLSGKTIELDLSEVEEAIKRQKKAARRKDEDEFLEADRVFHVALARLTGNYLFVSILENLRDKIHIMAAEALKQNRRAEEVLIEHQSILDCIRSGKKAKARQAMYYHLRRSRQAVMDQASAAEIQFRNGYS